MNNKNMSALLGALALCMAAPASAALYRCGNVFQDRPCDSQAQQEVLRPGGGASPSGAARRAASAPAAEAPAQAASTPASHPAAASSAAVAAASAPAPARKGPPSRACGNLREQHTAIESRLRAATRPETISMYERQMREVERNLDEGNCR